MSVRYCLHPARLLSRHDGQIHFIDIPTLASLYGVPVRECRVESVLGSDCRTPGVLCLHPLYKGDYRKELERLRQCAQQAANTLSHLQAIQDLLEPL